MADDQNEKKGGLSIDKFVAIFGLFTTISVVATAHIGRIFVNAYYTALHIPPELITISIQDYSSIGWPIILFDLLLILGATLAILVFAVIGAFLANFRVRTRWMIIGIVIGIGGLIARITSNTSYFVLSLELAGWMFVYAFPDKFLWLKTVVAQRVHVSHLSNQTTIRRLFELAGLVFTIIFGLASFITFVVLVERFAQDNARSRAARAIEQAGTSIRIDSSVPLSLSTPYTLTTSGTVTLYTYHDLYYLTFNNDRHFLYTCLANDRTPGPVLWIKENENFTITVDTAQQQEPACLITPTAQSLPTTSPISVPTPTVELTTTPTP